MEKSVSFKMILKFSTILLAVSMGCAKAKKNSPQALPPPQMPINNGPQGQGCPPQGGCQGGGGYYHGHQPTVAAQIPGGCPMGQIGIPGSGCAPQGNCPANYGFSNNQCTQGTIAVFPVPGNAGYHYGVGDCPPSQIYTYYGCAPTAGCPSNQGMHNYQCIPPFTIGSNGVPSGYNGGSYNGGYNPGFNGGFNGGFNAGGGYNYNTSSNPNGSYYPNNTGYPPNNSYFNLNLHY